MSDRCAVLSERPATMQRDRRQVLKHGAGLLAALLACGLLPERIAMAAADQAFDAVTFDDALKSLGGVTQDSPQLTLAVPNLVENGAFVPVSVTSRLPGTQEICIVVELNPNPMVARFTILEGTDPFVATRVKVGQSCNIYAVVKAEGKLYSSMKHTDVTIGGCG